MLVADKSEVLDLYRGAIRAGQAPTLAEASALLRFHEGDPMWSVAGPYRAEVVRELGFGLPCHEAIRAIVDIGKPVLEVAAGSGLWSFFLARAGVDVVASDIRHLLSDDGYSWTSFHAVEEMDAGEAVAKYAGRAVLMVWPPYKDPMAERVMATMAVGQILIYVGEIWGSCGTVRFSDELEGGFRHLGMMETPTWEGLHDYMTICVKERDVHAFLMPLQAPTARQSVSRSDSRPHAAP